MAKFRQCLTELSARNRIMAGNYSLTFLLSLKTCLANVFTEVRLVSAA